MFLTPQQKLGHTVSEPGIALVDGSWHPGVTTAFVHIECLGSRGSAAKAMISCPWSMWSMIPFSRIIGARLLCSKTFPDYAVHFNTLYVNRRGCLRQWETFSIQKGVRQGGHQFDFVQGCLGINNAQMKMETVPSWH